MIFTPDQVEELIKVIRFQHVLFGVDIAGIDVLSNSEIQLLRSYGVDPSTILKDLPVAEQAFQFGRLASALGNYDTKKVKYPDFLKFVRGGGHRALSEAELRTLEIIKSRSYAAIKGLGSRIESETTQIIGTTEATRRAEYEDVLRDTLAEGVKNRQSVAEIVSELGHKTGDWDRNLGRIVDTEMHNAYEEGRAAELRSVNGDSVKVYKDVYDGACKWCIKLYLTKGIGSAPIVFTLSSLEANGTNIGKKTSDWKATVGGVHPHCRCTMHKFIDGYEWNSSKRVFEAPKGYTKRYDYDVTITVGDEVFHI